MANRRPRSITPSLQFLIVCTAIDVDDDHQVSFRGVFDTVGLPMLGDHMGVELRFWISAQFRGGTGEHKYWLSIRHPNGVERTTDEQSFWLASKVSAHRLDTRVMMTIGSRDAGRYELIAMLDGRSVLSVPLIVNAPNVPTDPT